VLHKHVKVNGKIVNISSYRVRDNDKIEIHEASRKIAAITTSLTQAATRQSPSWVEVDKAGFTGVFKSLPPREELNEPSMREQLVVEYYSR
jgi:small subunit ribosomal protein S4